MRPQTRETLYGTKVSGNFRGRIIAEASQQRTIKKSVFSFSRGNSAVIGFNDKRI